MAVEIPQRVLDGIWDRIDVRGPDECWPWKLSIGSHGYGQVGWWEDGRNRMTTAMRAAWTAVHGPIPEDMTVDHKCWHKPCCNPAHLQLLTQADNSRISPWAMRTHCKNGHEYREDSIRRNKQGWRICLLCERTRNRSLAARRKAERAARRSAA